VTRTARRVPGMARLELETLVPLLAVYFLLVTLYVWQAWRRETPTVFTDELELTQLSRAIADTGEAARRGEARGFTSLVPWLTAPGWWIGSVSTAYETIKYAQALVMAAAMFPAYLVARMVASYPWAVFAGVATAAAPALSYAPILVEEPWAYPASALALWLIVRATLRPGWRTVGLALGASAVAAGCRSQLVALFPVLGISLAAVAWRSPRARVWRATWSRWDWGGAAMLLLGAVFFFSAFMGHRSEEWFIATSYWKGRILDYGIWAAGAFAIGVGLLPVVAALAVLIRPRGSRGDPRTTAFVIVTVAALASFGWYAAVKGAYLSTVFSSLIVERNLIYLAPLVFAGTALALERRDVRWWAGVPAGLVVLYLVTTTPIGRGIDQYPYYEAHGLSILALPNRLWRWPVERIDNALIVAIAVATLLVIALWPVARRHARAGAALAATIAALVLTWNLTNEIYAANGEHKASTQFLAGFTDPPDWVDRATGRGSVVLVGQQFGSDANGIHLTEFWNRGIEKVWSVDPTSPAPGPGPTLTPDLAAADGTLGSDPGTDYALAVNGVTLQSPVVEQRGTTNLYRLEDGPLKLAFSQTGVFSDGWMSTNAAYNRFDVQPDDIGFAKVTVSKEGFCSTQAPTSTVVVKVGPVEIGDDRQPRLARVSDEKRVRLKPCEARPMLLRPPREPWRVEVEIDKTFVPNAIDPRSSDLRNLGAQIAFEFVDLG
jgi:hypothetical protein